MKNLHLPPRIDGTPPPELPCAHKIAIIGANGAGKSRFMQEMINLCGDRAFILSALDAALPGLKESTVPGSIDAQYREAILQQAYMRSDAVSQLDKLSYMLFADEFEYLLSLKSSHADANAEIRLKPTKLDKLKQIWERIFPGSTIVSHNGRLKFANSSGDDLITMPDLSQGEKAVLYYIAASLYAPMHSAILIESPTLFLHPSIIPTLWDSVEELRPDCLFVYNSVDIEFVTGRDQTICIWVKSYDAQLKAWDYDILKSDTLSEQIFLELAGTRKPVLFVEGDTTHSIDNKLYSLVFNGYTVRPLGSCNKVIETTRSFNDLKYMHHLDSHGIVDRDRRTEKEVEYLRNKNILVPEVAEIENIFLLENVIHIMAKIRGRDPGKVIKKVKNEVLRIFKGRAEEQALMHVRHKMKRDVERLVDAKFKCITALETHIKQLVYQLKPREYYLEVRQSFAAMVRDADYAGVLRVFNHKPILGDSHVAQLLGFRTREEYVDGVLAVLAGHSRDAENLRRVIKYCFGIVENEPVETDRQQNTGIFSNTPPHRKRNRRRKNRKPN